MAADALVTSGSKSSTNNVVDKRWPILRNTHIKTANETKTHAELDGKKLAMFTISH